MLTLPLRPWLLLGGPCMPMLLPGRVSGVRELDRLARLMGRGGGIIPVPDPAGGCESERLGGRA
jgi:hypothetical protein